MLSKQIGVPLYVLEFFCNRLNKTIPKSLIRSFIKLVGKKERKLYDTAHVLKIINRKINRMLQGIKLPPEIFGGVRGKSVKDNASLHLNSKYLDKLDIKNFFPSLRPRMIKELFMRLGCSAKVARMLTRLTTVDGVVPQGFPTSTMLANLYIAVFCHDVIKKNTGDKYTISYWVDDIAISSKTPTAYKDIKEIGRLLEKRKLILNRAKTKRKGPRQYREITGVAINGKIGISKTKYYNLERDMFLLRRHSPMWIAQTIYPKEYAEQKRKNKNIDVWFIASIKGDLGHVKSLDFPKWQRIMRRYHDVIESYKLLKSV